MAADYAQMMRDLTAFYDFDGKTVVSIGAGGGQFLDPDHPARKIVAIDHDDGAIAQLQRAVTEHGLGDKFRYLHGDFLTMELPLRADVVLFEFCLHEMLDVRLALTRAGTLAPDVVVFDHGRTSEWAYYVAEEAKVAASWKAVESIGALRHQQFAGEQKFRDYAELVAKVQPQGEVALERIEKFKGRADIVIPMTYELALVRTGGACSPFG